MQSYKASTHQRSRKNTEGGGGKSGKHEIHTTQLESLLQHQVKPSKFNKLLFSWLGFPFIGRSQLQVLESKKNHAKYRIAFRP